MNAQLCIGILVLDGGTAIARDGELEFHYVSKAAAQGDLEAFQKVAWCHSAGIGTVCNPERALEWYLKAATQGCAEAQFQVGERCRTGDGTIKDPQLGTGWS